MEVERSRRVAPRDRPHRGAYKKVVVRPVPPGSTPKSKDARWLDIREGDRLDEAQMADWVKQGAALPGWVP
jgi:hypothetical protein